MLITTGKKPGNESRLIAASLAASVPGSRLENRGQRTISSLISKARRLHFSRLCTIHAEEGKPHRISFLSLEDEKGWGRLSPIIMVRKIADSPKQGCKFRQSKCLSISGTRAKTINTLLLPRNSSDETESKIAASAKKISIFISNKKILELGVSYEKQK